MSTAEKYQENLSHNIAQHRDARAKTVRFISETESAIAGMDGRKVGVLATLKQRLEQARLHVQRHEGTIHDLDLLETHIPELAEIDDQIAALLTRRRELTNNDQLHHSLKTKNYGIM
jgi:DNA integrity scanning protein DisA with diadenylate cyclase activity